MTARYHVETIGSLQRPEYLLSAREQHRTGALSHAAFKQIEDRAVDEAIALQENIGLDVITDGEQRRFSFLDYVLTTSTGLASVPSYELTLQSVSAGLPNIPMTLPVSITGRVLPTCSSVTTEEFVYLRARAVKPVKITLPSPLAYLVFIGPETRSVYPDPFELFYDAAQVLNQECRRLAALGCQYIQIDAPELTWPGDPLLRETAFKIRGISPDRFASEACELLNVVTDVPNVRFGLHLCRGNHPTHRFSLGSYEAIGASVLNRTTHITTFLMEYDDPQLASFESLRQIPEDRSVALGLVSSMKRSTLESRDELVQRINEAARYFPREHLAISPQCGFCSQVGVTGFSHSVQEAKLRLLVDVARTVWSS